MQREMSGLCANSLSAMWFCDGFPHLRHPPLPSHNSCEVFFKEIWSEYLQLLNCDNSGWLIVLPWQ